MILYYIFIDFVIFIILVSDHFGWVWKVFSLWSCWRVWEAHDQVVFRRMMVRGGSSQHLLDDRGIIDMTMMVGWIVWACPT